MLFKRRKNKLMARKRRVFWCLLGPGCFLLWFLLVAKPRRVQTIELLSAGESEPQTILDGDLGLGNIHGYDGHQVYPMLQPSVALEFREAPVIRAHSLTAILPVLPESLPNLEATLSLLSPSTCLRDILVVCPESIISQTRRILRAMVSTAENFSHPDISLRPWIGEMDQTTSIMRVASQVSAEWVLFLDDTGLQKVDKYARDTLLNPRAVSLPVGPRGVVLSHNNVSFVVSSQNPQPASYLLPPFVMPSSLILAGAQPSFRASWAGLGKRTSQSRPDALGGIVMGSVYSAEEWRSPVHQEAVLPSDRIPGFVTGPQLVLHDMDYTNLTNSPTELKAISGVFAILFPFLKDLHLFSLVACKLQDKGYLIHILLYNEPADSNYSSPDWKERTVVSKRCRLKYDVLSTDMRPSVGVRHGAGFLSEWLDTLDRAPDIVLTLTGQDVLTAGLDLIKHNATLIRISQDDLPYSTWMGILSLKEWKNWNVPRIDVSIITKDRPQSLARLLSSLTKGRFFGDTLNLRVNLEQSSDAETLEMIDNLRWEHGSLFVHHRVIHGGLLPAVVESWFPHSNDTYGLLLEDDIELSPLFYGWIKMSILRYRYGDQENRSPQLFGISLYQQKNIELRPEGRRPFNAWTLFSNIGLPHPSTPYLSQIPCSWGAIYFPEHWREFHEYLSFRLSEFSIKIEQNIVPDVRSNKWTKSWKKFFVELVYLRGYVMLYPNYEDFISLSTNHLEVGSHVKDRSKEKQELFLLPLMRLPDGRTQRSPSLLDLPNQTLPSWQTLPVLNLTGMLTSLEDLAREGESRRTELTECSKPSFIPYNVRDLMCISDVSLA